MAFTLPPAPKKYSQLNEQQSRRTIEDELTALFERLARAEAEIAAGGGTPAVGPTANFTFTTDGLIASFEDASTAGDAAIVERLWTFGDGTTSTALNNSSPEHTYPDAGDYQVTLTVTDADGLEDTSDPQTVTVTEDVTGSGVVFLVRGANVLADIVPDFDWWNAAQLGAMTPSTAQARIQEFADAGMQVGVRLYQTNSVTDANGNFSLDAYETSVARYFNAGLAPFLNEMAEAGVIVYADVCDDVLKVDRWGKELSPADIDNMCGITRNYYPSIPAWARARVNQLHGDTFNYQHLQGCTSIYLSGRGDVTQGSMTDAEYRIADCEAFRDTELADWAADFNSAISVSFGLNIINGGDGTSGIPGDGSPPGKFKMSATELDVYSNILVPAIPQVFTTHRRVFQMWEWASDGTSDSYLTSVASAMNSIRTLCDNS